MPIVETGVFIVIKRFPERETVLKRLFKRSESFQTLCEDYRLCTSAVRHWDASLSEEAPARRAEYSALMRELETEIARELNDYEHGG